VLEILTEHPDRTRDQIAEGPRRRGFDIRGQPLMILSTTSTRTRCSANACRGPRKLDRDEALGELVLRYFTGRGPATERDLACWATLTLTDVRRGLSCVGEGLASFDHDGPTYWHDPADPPRRR
jgi:hypothetical protein